MASPTAASRVRLSPLILLSLLVAACASSPEEDASASAPAPPTAAPVEIVPGPAQLTPAAEQPSELVPGLGPETREQIPEESEQVIVTSGSEAGSERATTVLYERVDDGWVQRALWRGHNGSGGWSADRTEGDRTSPSGVFPLSDAGGSRPDPGSLLPYTQDDAYRWEAEATYGDDMARVFDYVIAIDYNRVQGRPPSDDERPEGWDPGGKIWLHLDHGSGTRGCVTVSEEGMELLLRTLDPEKSPMIAMGVRDDLAR